MSAPLATIERMFDSTTVRPSSSRRDPAALAALASLAERTRPLVSSQSRLLPTPAPLAGLLPDGALRRGTTLVIGSANRSSGPEAGGASGERTLALALVSAASASGSWCALLGCGDLGAEAAEGLGLDLTRLAVIPHPGPAWAEATAAMLDGVDLVLLCPPVPPRPAMARRLVARARERRAVLVVLPGRSGWPEGADLHLRIDDSVWQGAEAGVGPLRRRRMTVAATGRRQAVRSVCRHLWLPDTDGSVRTVEAGDEDGLDGGRSVVGSAGA
jgi:hypothetical protein